MNINSFKLPLNGGISSKGERHIEDILQKVSDKLNFFYNREVKFGKFDGKLRRADFGFRYNNRMFLIEFDGIQHSQPIDFGEGSKLDDIKKRDHWENTVFCPNNNICLIRYKVFSQSTSAKDHIEAQNKLLNFITPERLENDIMKAMSCKYVQNSVSYGRPKLRIGLDIDDTIVDWRNAHEKRFKCKLSAMEDHQITKQVLKCRNDKEFWTNLKLLEKPDFTPELYCTKRINSKDYTKTCLDRLKLPIRPIYQIYTQAANKANYVKGRCDVLIDDSYSNVKACIDKGLPALLITRPHNKHIDTPYRINHLRYKDIADKYYELKREGKWD